jgi:hypothetical protein
VHCPWVLVVLCVSGCTALLGLDKVSSVDRDNDRVEDSVDNCPNDYNPDQSDFDHNGAGDACDLCTNGGTADVDHDGIPDGCDGCIGIGVDVDHDGIDDGCDLCIGNGMDVDHDGIDDACDTCIGKGVDADHDGIDDACDSCIATGVDADQDGVDDGCDACIAPGSHVDVDHDGIEDACDPCIGPHHDEDSDGIDDTCDNCPSIANPGQEHALDTDPVGDVCDLGLATNKQFFDPFIAQDPLWFVQGFGWAVGGDVALLDVPPTPSFRFHETVSAEGMTRTAVKLHFPESPVGGWVEVILANGHVQPASATIECRATSTANPAIGQLSLIVITNAGISLVATTSTPVDMTNFALQLHFADGKFVQCQADSSAGSASIFASPVAVGQKWAAGLAGYLAKAEFSYMDVVH